MDTYRPERDLSDGWLATVKGWIDANGEVLIVLRYLAAAGARDYGLITSYEGLLKMIEECPIGTDVIAVQGPHLPLRGTVDERFITEAQNSTPAEVEYLIVALDRTMPGHGVSGFADVGHGMMRDDLEVFLGERVAIGLCPDYNVADHTGMISFAKGGIDGPR